MSTTYEISCDQCRVHYWCGQRGGGSKHGRLYSAEKTFDFLDAHQGHPLQFNMSEFSPSGYADGEPPERAK